MLILLEIKYIFYISEIFRGALFNISQFYLLLDLWRSHKEYLVDDEIQWDWQQIRRV